ncbi:MAG TPA: ATP-binding protein [Candidatus Methanomethylophilaceae archaeon]|nr:ATP-binding protein [Candidatus Methanomethylophilaceae archaeon]
MVDQTSDNKKQWRKKHLRIVCAFSNSYGGRLSIGKADSFLPEEARDLATRIYNDISETLDIYPNVRPAENKGRTYIVIDVKPNPDPVSLKGAYYRRIGKEDRELTGDELEKFILLRDRRARLGLLVPGAIFSDLDDVALNRFKELSNTPDNVDNVELLRNMNLTQKDLMKGSAVVMFHKDPSRFFVAPNIKIGRYASSGKMEDMDEASGPAFLQPMKAMEILRSKYIREGVYPVEALEEAIINAVAHKDYMIGDPIRIRVSENSISITNPGGVSKKSLETGLEGFSRPANPTVSDIFVRAGKMNIMGAGIPHMKAECRRLGIQEPDIVATENDFSVTFTTTKSSPEFETADETFAETSTYVHKALEKDMFGTYDIRDRESRIREFRIISLLTVVGDEEVPARELMERLEMRHRPTFMSNYVEPAIEDGFVERTEVKPTSKNQRYRATRKGLELLF